MGRAGNVETTEKASAGYATVGGKRFYARSTWESNIAAYYEFLKQQKLIADWEHEPHTFWFLEIKRGVRSYLPDFKITNLDGSHFWVEVKGWMDAKSKTKLARMSKYYPGEKLEVIDAKRYYAIKKNSPIYPEWGAMESAKVNEEDQCMVPGCVKAVKARKMCAKHHDQVYGKS